MPEQMTLLRNALDARKIEWLDDSDDLDRSFPFLNMTIYRTKYVFKNRIWSVICGVGTFGADYGLLELMIDNNEPIGSLSASTILGMMDDD